ncbi:MAG TPA: hypothetical protein VMY06_07710 [Sedimentisphaerales bacterium]|nr:hypothetical protein [Sedimentisphaerales bacterium]
MTKTIDILRSRLIELAQALLAVDWDYELACYVYKSTGKAVANSVMLGWADSYTVVVKTRISMLTEKFIDGSITLEQWQQRMAIEIKDGWIVSANIGRGGRSMMTQADWGRTGGRLQYEYSRLRMFAEKIKMGDLSDAEIMARAQLYANATRLGYFDGLTSAKADVGFTYEQRFLNPAEHCGDCVTYADMGIQPIGTLPEPGEASQCGRNCKCTKVYYKPEDLEGE